MTFDEAIATLRYREVRECRDNGNQVLLAIAEEVARLRACVEHLSGVGRTDPMMDNAILKAEEFIAKYRYVALPVRDGEVPGVHQLTAEQMDCECIVVGGSLPELSTVDSEPTEGDRIMEFFKGGGA